MQASKLVANNLGEDVDELENSADRAKESPRSLRMNEVGQRAK